MKNAVDTYARALCEVLSDDLNEKEIERRIDSFVVLIREKHALHLGDRIIGRFVSLFNEKLGVVQADLTVRDSKSVDVKVVQEALSKRLNKTVELSVIADASVVGGARLHLGDHLYDNTIKNRLSQLQQQLTA